MRKSIIVAFLISVSFYNFVFGAPEITFNFSNEDISSVKSDYIVLFVEKDFTFSKELQTVSNAFFPNLKELMEQKQFTGSANSELLIPVYTESGITNLLFLGLDAPNKNQKLNIENFRRALGLLVRTIEKEKFKSITIKLPPASEFGVKNEYLGKQVGTILNMALYHFDQFMTNEDEKLNNKFDITLIVDDKDKTEVEDGVTKGKCIGQAVNHARLWVDMPPSDMNPSIFEHNAREIAKAHGIDITVIDEQTAIGLGMGGLRAVSVGSDREACIVIMEYKTTKENAPTIAFVGKGITFDAGGLSLKSSKGMENMKFDMAGAAAVIASMDAIAQLKPDVNVICVAPLSENLPSGKAFMPGDIIRFYNGKTAEIKNTDAEGRLVLADALSYIVEQYKPDAIVDLATLTGSVISALGHFFCGMMSNNNSLAKKIKTASDISGDRVCQLPLHDDYKASIKSSVADISNLGDKKYGAGSISAAFFLKNFIGDTPWVHLDIAGTAFDVPDISYFREGATGFGVRLLVDLAMGY